VFGLAKISTRAQKERREMWELQVELCTALA
jgi:hypothetical protein